MERRETRLDGIRDEAGNLMEDYDPALGRLEERRKIVRHEAVEGVAEEGHYETVAEYPNGGKDVAWVVDVPGVEAREAWEETVVCSVYVPYTQEELAEIEAARNQPTAEEQIAELRAVLEALMGGIADANN